MTVVSNAVVQDPPETDGSGQRIVTYVYEFHNGEYRQRSYRRDATGFDYEAEATALIPDVEQAIIDEEVGSLVEHYSVEDAVGNPVTEQPVHPETDTALVRRRRFHRKLVRRLIRLTDIKLVRAILYLIWYWLKNESGYNPSQIANYLNVTLGQLTTFDDRMQAYHDNLAFIDAEAAIEDWD